MDINTLRGLSTIFVMIAFISICLWAFSGRKKEDFEDAAKLPFQDDDIAMRTLSKKERVQHD